MKPLADKAEIAALSTLSEWRTEVIVASQQPMIVLPTRELEPEPTVRDFDIKPISLETPDVPPAWWLPVGITVGLGAALLLAWVAFAIGRRGAPANTTLAGLDPPGARLALSLPGADGRMTASLFASASQLLQDIRERLEPLSPVMPLRQVLAREVHLAAQRLQILADKQLTGPDESQTRTRQRLQAVVRDLQRLKNITDGVHSSLGTSGALVPAEMPEPRDKAEAYAMLGVNPDANDRILKKLVDALRQSWHPDLARDEDDRRRREHRVKHINIAWDLIQGKRVES